MCTPRSRSAASVRVAYSAPLAPVIATATRRRGAAASVDIDGQRRRGEVENADVAVEILTGIQNVESADPRADGQPEEPRLEAAASAGRDPAAHWSHGHGETEKQLRIAGVALGDRVPEHDDQRDR